MLQLAALDGVLLGERCAACGWMGPRNGCGWHGVIAAIEEFVEDVLSTGHVAPDALSVRGPDPRKPADRTGCVHVAVHPSLVGDVALRSRISDIAAEWDFEIQGADTSGFWLGHGSAPATRGAPRTAHGSPRLGVVHRAVESDASGS